ncbi:hypothetical protein [Paucisalibacillus globulus]|uniref:hypothetical protein n=1 Tax=Paucisalibacillus globulus TaxID=351095 RepID=UPI0003FA0F27|nr:hypothetical protein [Paucisalibacillus globulus]
MSKQKIEQQVNRYAIELIKEKGYVSPIELLIKMERLTLKQVEDWRFRKIPYLERVTNGNLSKLNYTLQVLKRFAAEMKLKPSITSYKSWGKGPKKLLLFSKTGSPYIEELYSTHYVRPNNKKIEQKNT